MSVLDKRFDDYYAKRKFYGGNTCCPGCGGPLFWRMAMDVFGPRTVVYGIGPCAGCTMRSIKLPSFNIHFSFVADGASGILAAFRAQGIDDITVISSAGDGGTADIGLGKISAAAERNENMIQICIDNEAYMNTGIQKSGLTPYGSWTTTTPLGKEAPKKDVPLILAAHHIPYVATVSVAYPQDLKKKLETAKSIKGFRYIHAVIPCPTGWRFDPSKSIEVTKLGVDTWLWPLYEINDGILKMNMKKEAKPVKEYLDTQQRFRVMKQENIEWLQKETDKRREELISLDGKKLFY
ncbi:pyruvate synthase subunit beta [Candidatus Bathyarchaeota archaeon]|nr:pyruvate synthase subunit beta [Candidatus Bathyarchaeota archaeon]